MSRRVEKCPYVSMEGYIGCCPVRDISVMVAPVDVKFCMMVGPTYRSRTDLPFRGRYLRIPKSKIFGLNSGHFTANISKAVRRNVTCQLELYTYN